MSLQSEIILMTKCSPEKAETIREYLLGHFGCLGSVKYSIMRDKALEIDLLLTYCLN